MLSLVLRSTTSVWLAITVAIVSVILVYYNNHHHNPAVLFQQLQQLPTIYNISAAAILKTMSEAPKMKQLRILINRYAVGNKTNRPHTHTHL